MLHNRNILSTTELISTEMLIRLSPQKNSKINLPIYVNIKEKILTFEQQAGSKRNRNLTFTKKAALQIFDFQSFFFTFILSCAHARIGHHFVQSLNQEICTNLVDDSDSRSWLRNAYWTGHIARFVRTPLSIVGATQMSVSGSIPTLIQHRKVASAGAEVSVKSFGLDNGILECWRQVHPPLVSTTFFIRMTPVGGYRRLLIPDISSSSRLLNRTDFISDSFRRRRV